MFKTLNLKDFKEKIGEKDFVLLDVRTDRERLIIGKIGENQIDLDIYNPKTGEDILKLDKTKKYLIYCAHGNRSLVVLNFMKENDFSWACDLEGGFENWKNNY